VSARLPIIGDYQEGHYLHCLAEIPSGTAENIAHFLTAQNTSGDVFGQNISGVYYLWNCDSNRWIISACAGIVGKKIEINPDQFGLPAVSSMLEAWGSPDAYLRATLESLKSRQFTELPQPWINPSVVKA